MAENPLTEEQIERLNEIARLPAEEQKQELNKFLKTLSPEQINFLRSQQGGGCLFCSLAEKKTPSRIVYEDESFMGVLDIRPANKGHIIVFPKKHYQILGQMESKDIGRMFEICNKTASIIFEVVKAEGTNIFLANGLAAGQNMPHVSVHVIPRFKDDKVNFGWEGVKINDNEMSELEDELRGKIKLEEKEVVIKEEEVEEKENEEEYDDEEMIP